MVVAGSGRCRAVAAGWGEEREQGMGNVEKAMGEERRERVPEVETPATQPPVDDAVLEDKLRSDEASREEPPQVERVIDEGEVEKPGRD